MTWLERLVWMAGGAALAAPVYPVCEFITQAAVLGHSPLNPKENP